MTVEGMGTIERHDDRYTLRLSRVIAAPLERVWRAIIEPEEIAKWLGATVTHDARVEGHMRVDWEGSYLAGGRILAYDPPRLVEYEWDALPQRDSDSVVRFELREVSGGTELTLTHRGDDLDWRARSEALNPSYQALIAQTSDGGVA